MHIRIYQYLILVNIQLVSTNFRESFRFQKSQVDFRGGGGGNPFLKSPKFPHARGGVISTLDHFPNFLAFQFGKLPLVTQHKKLRLLCVCVYEVYSTFMCLCWNKAKVGTKLEQKLEQQLEQKLKEKLEQSKS